MATQSAVSAVKVTAFGQGRYEVSLPAHRATVGEILHAGGVEAAGHRIAVNGNPAGLGSTIAPQDEVTVVPRVHGG